MADASPGLVAEGVDAILAALQSMTAMRTAAPEASSGEEIALKFVCHWTHKHAGLQLMLITNQKVEHWDIKSAFGYIHFVPLSSALAASEAIQLVRNCWQPAQRM